MGKQFVYESGKGTKEVFKTGDPLDVPASGIGSDERAQDPMVGALNHLWLHRQKLMESVKWLLTSGDDNSRATASALVKEIDESNGLRPEASPLFPSEEKAQELVRQAIERGCIVSVEKSIYQADLFSFTGKATLNELEAMAWCMRNDKWFAR